MVKVDSAEIEVAKYGQQLFNILLKDRTTEKNIIWATSDYSDYGDSFQAQAEIELISKKLPNMIKPRIKKNKQKQSDRTREKAEVFTPSWICNKQNNLIDEQWFGFASAFNTSSKQNELWAETVKQNIFVICKTPMAKAITKRTLVGYKDIPVKAHYFQDLINMMKNKPESFVGKVQKADYWKMKGTDKVKFDAIVGNPPYQMETGSTSRQATPIYNYFVEQAKKINPNYLSMIMPSRWFAGGMGLDQFRNDMMSDKRIAKITDYVNAKDCFPQISISGGVCYFLYDSTHTSECEFSNVISGNKTTLKRPLNEFSVLVRYNEAVEILRKIQNLEEKSITEIISPLMPYGLSTNYRGKSEKEDDSDLVLHSSAGITYIKRDEISKGLESVDKYKVLMSKMSAEHAGEPNKDGMFNVFTKSTKVLKPGEVCTHSYFLIGNYDTLAEADNTLGYLKTKFVRFLVLMSLSAVNLSKLVFSFVPLQDFSKPWTDAELYAKYGLNEEEIAFIESMIKPME